MTTLSYNYKWHYMVTKYATKTIQSVPLWLQWIIWALCINTKTVNFVSTCFLMLTSAYGTILKWLCPQKHNCFKCHLLQPKFLEDMHFYCWLFCSKSIIYENFSKNNLGTMPGNKMTESPVIMRLQHLSLKYGRERGGGTNHAAHTWVFELRKEHSPRNGTFCILKLRMGSVNSFC